MKFIEFGINFIEFGINSNGETIYAKIDKDGLIRMTCSENNPEYQIWLNNKMIDNQSKLPYDTISTESTNL